MKNRMFVASFAALAIAGTASANVTVVTDANLSDYTGASSISIPAGDTLQFSGISSAYTLSAPISGGGTLLMDGCTGVATLAGDNSSFSGALVATNSSVTVGHVNALGTATVSIVSDSAEERTFLYRAASRLGLCDIAPGRRSGAPPGETVKTVSDFIFLGSKITADGDCTHG